MQTTAGCDLVVGKRVKNWSVDWRIDRSTKEELSQSDKSNERSKMRFLSLSTNVYPKKRSWEWKLFSLFLLVRCFISHSLSATHVYLHTKCQIPRRVFVESDASIRTFVRTSISEERGNWRRFLYMYGPGCVYSNERHIILWQVVYRVYGLKSSLSSSVAKSFYLFMHSLDFSLPSLYTNVYVCVYGGNWGNQGRNGGNAVGDRARAHQCLSLVLLTLH